MYNTQYDSQQDMQARRERKYNTVAVHSHGKRCTYGQAKSRIDQTERTAT
jgi:hypothetical protein